MSKSSISHEEYERYFYDVEYSKIKRYRLANWHRAYLYKTFENLKVHNTNIFLDIGAGGLAYEVIEFARKGITSIGIDISSKAMITAHRIARETLSMHLSTNYHFIIASASHIPLRTNCVDILTLIAVLEHIPDDNLTILESARTLRRGAKAFITVPNKRSLWDKLPGIKSLYKQHDRKVGHLRHYNAEEIISKFNKAGFTLNRIYYHAHLPRIISFVIEMLFKDENNITNAIWWRLENLDECLSIFPSGMQISIVFVK